MREADIPHIKIYTISLYHNKEKIIIAYFDKTAIMIKVLFVCFIRFIFGEDVL